MTYSNHYSTERLSPVLYLLLTLIILAFSCPAQADDTGEGFDHFSTGFPLIGRHEFIDCADCHIASQFKGTPMECGICHNGIRAPGKNIKHVPSGNLCGDCHTERTWISARYDHVDVQQPCQNCHNNTIAAGKSPSHIPLNSQTCDECHNTITFNRVARVDHSSVLGLCSSCHNGVIARGKNPGHVPTGIEECNYCHTVFSWLPAANNPIPRP